jgi:phage terminase large subunit-like protein
VTAPFYVVADLSGRYGPHEWAEIAVASYKSYMGDRIVAEIKAGGAVVEAPIRHIDRNVPIRTVHASRGKVTRAEPISALYEQGRVHHVGTFPALEDQMCSFTSDLIATRPGIRPIGWTRSFGR